VLRAPLPTEAVETDAFDIAVGFPRTEFSAVNAAFLLDDPSVVPLVHLKPAFASGALQSVVRFLLAWPGHLLLLAAAVGLPVWLRRTWPRSVVTAVEQKHNGQPAKAANAAWWAAVMALIVIPAALFVATQGATSQPP
jgi:hypothetical protein